LCRIAHRGARYIKVLGNLPDTPTGLAQIDDLLAVRQFDVPIQIVQGAAVDPATVLSDQLGLEDARGH